MDASLKQLDIVLLTINNRVDYFSLNVFGSVELKNSSICRPHILICPEQFVSTTISLQKPFPFLVLTLIQIHLAKSTY